MATHSTISGIVKIGNTYIPTANAKTRYVVSALSKVEACTDFNDAYTGRTIQSKVTEYNPADTNNPNIYYSTVAPATVLGALNTP